MANSNTPKTSTAQIQPPSGPARVGKAPIAPGSTEPTRGEGLALPHESDESTSSVAQAPDPVIAQAKRDIDAGLVDTDMRATPGLDTALRKKLVSRQEGRPTATDSKPSNDGG